MKTIKKKSNTYYRVFPNLFINIWIHMFSIIISILIIDLSQYDYSNGVNKFLLILSISLPILTIISFIYSNTFGWNAPVYFDKEKIFQKRHGRIINWKWDEIEIECKTHRPFLLRIPPFPPRIKIKSTIHSKVLGITLDRCIRKKFSEICPNENVRAKYLELLEKCDFPYL